MAYIALLALLLCLWGCESRQNAAEVRTCRVVLEENAAYRAEGYVRELGRGEDAVFLLQEAEGYTVGGTDYGDYTLEREPEGVRLTLHAVRYSTVVQISARKSDVIFRYHANGGERLDGGDAQMPVEVPVTDTHLRLNTSQGRELFSREGYTLTGWNTAPDGTGRRVGLGSRAAPEEGELLYAQWSKWSPAEEFRFSEGTVTAYLGTERVVTVPEAIGGVPVRVIAEDAFRGCGSETVILPASLQTIAPGAFRDAGLKTLYLFDSLRSVSDYAFQGCGELQTLYINAALPPVYAGTYYAAFPDKYDRLLSLRDRRKLVLFSGSSTRFGYDSAAIDAAFPDFDVVNMGVFAYTNALPQLELILGCMGEGDILLHAPELDAARRQFCAENTLDAPFFNMMEENYDAAAELDLRSYTHVFSALNDYLAARQGLEGRSYALRPADFDEDGRAVDTPSYNSYGDYILFRPNAADDTPIYGLPVHYTASYYLKDVYLDPFNAEMARFAEKGVRAYLTYSPRNRLALSEDSTEEEIEGLDRYFRENLSIPVISRIQDSLVPGRYLSGTDNHLSTEGVAIRTARIIRELRAQLELEGAD